jgi:hypothetical protein
MEVPMDARQTILRALRGRDISLHHRTIAFNRPAEKLESFGAPVLEQIENIILSDWEPAVGADWFGLTAVLFMYFRLAAKVKHKNMPAFLMRLPNSVREQAIRSIFVLWGPVGAAHGIAFPPRLLGPITRLTQDGTSTERSLARRLLSHLIRRPVAEGRRPSRGKPVVSTRS